MKSNGINQPLVWHMSIIICAVILLFLCIQRMEWKMSGDSDKVTAEQFASFYLATPTSQLNNLRGWGTCGYSETMPTGYIYFDCDQEPILNDSRLYKEGGDTIVLTDKFLQQFGKNAWPLLHSSELLSRYMKEGPSTPRRFLLYNRKTTRYFFARI